MCACARVPVHVRVRGRNMYACVCVHVRGVYACMSARFVCVVCACARSCLVFLCMSDLVSGLDL